LVTWFSTVSRYLSSIEMTRRNSSPSPLSQVSVTGLSTPSAFEPCWVQTVLLSGAFTGAPAPPTQPNSA
jgi:hypothetical protein